MTSSIFIKRFSQSLQSLSPSWSVSQQLISKFIFQGSYQSALVALASNLTNFITIDFYTDRSLSNDGTIHMIMDISWTTAFSNTPNYTFHVALSNNPSSTKAETIAILTALITYSANAMVNIFTDLQYYVDHFNRLKYSSFTTTHYKSSSHPNYLQ